MAVVNRQVQLIHAYLAVQGKPPPKLPVSSPSSLLDIDLNPFIKKDQHIGLALQQASIEPPLPEWGLMFDHIMTQIDHEPVPEFKGVRLHLGNQILEIPVERLNPTDLKATLVQALQTFQPQKQAATVTHLQYTAKPVIDSVRSPVAQKQRQLTEAQMVQQVLKLKPSAIHPGNFTRLTQWLAAYNNSTISPKPPLKPEVVAHLETLFILQATKRSPQEQQRLLAMLPNTDAHDLQLFKQRGSLALIGQLKAQEGGLGRLAPSLRQTMTNQVNRFLALSGSSLQIQSLKTGELEAAIKELESRLGLPVTGQFTVENLRQIEKAQKNLLVIITNVRNIVHDEILDGHSDKASQLKQWVGTGGVINQQEALKHLQVMRQQYFWLTNKAIPADKFSMDLYFDTMKARQNWLVEKREVDSQHHLYTRKESGLVRAILLRTPGQQMSYSQLQAASQDTRKYTLKERAAIQKLIQNPTLFDYTWSILVQDKNQDGKLDSGLHPPDRTQAVLSLTKLSVLSEVLMLEKVSLGGQSNIQGIHIPEFYDGREIAAKIYDDTNVSGDEWFAWTGLGMGTNEASLKQTLQSSQTARGKIMALKRDYERLYHSELKAEIQDELGGGVLGEALTYLGSPGEDVLAEQQVGTGARAEVLLAKFKPQIAQIGADNGPIAWMSGHSSDDKKRQQELESLYTKAQQALHLWKAVPHNTGLEKELLRLTAQILIRLEADDQADRYYQQAKDEAIAITKNIAIVATATVVTIATAGAGAPAAAAIVAGTAAGTAVAFTGEATDQLGTYLAETERNAIAQQVAREQQANIKALGQEGDATFKGQVMQELNQKIKGLEQAQKDRPIFDRDKLWQATFEGFKTSLVTSVTTVATMGLSQWAAAGKVKAVVATLGKGGQLGQQALINGLSGVTGDVAGQILAPLHLKKHTAKEARQVIAQMKTHLQNNLETAQQLEAESKVIKARLAAFYQGYQTDTAATQVTLITTVKSQLPTEAEIKQVFLDQLRLQEIQTLSVDLNKSNQQVKQDIAKLEKNIDSASPLEWNNEEWSQITEHLGRNLALSFVAGATLNLINGNKLLSRLAFNAASSTVQTVGRNAIEKYIDGKADKKLFDGVIQGILSSLIVGEAAHFIQHRQAIKSGLQATPEGKAWAEWDKDPSLRQSPEHQQMLTLLKENGFVPESPETHAEAFAKVAKQHPEFSHLLQGSVNIQKQQMVQDFLQKIGEGAQQVKGSAEKTIEQFLAAHEKLQLLKQQKQAVLKEPDSLERTQKLTQIEQQSQTWQQVADDIAQGKQVYNAEGKAMGDALTPPQRAPAPSEIAPRTREMATRLEAMAQAKGDTAAQLKIQQLLNESAPDLTDDIKAEFMSRVESRLQDPKYQDKPLFDVMKSVVKDDPQWFTKKGPVVPLEVLQEQGVFSRVFTMTAAYRDYMTSEQRQVLRDQYGIQDEKQFATWVKNNPDSFDISMLNANAMISGGNDTGWWSPKGQSQAQNVAELAKEVAVDPKRFEAGTVRVSLSPEAIYQMGVRKPTALDGMFAEWIAVDNQAPLGKTEGGKAEGVVAGISLNKMTSIEIFNAQGRKEVSIQPPPPVVASHRE